MTRQSKRSGLFHGFWWLNGRKSNQRVTRPELAEAYRLWAVHRDIREGAVGAEARVSVDFPSSPLREHPSTYEPNPFYDEDYTTR